MSVENRTRAVRDGEELDVPALKAFLEAEWGRSIGDLVVEQFPGGYSNLTYLVRIDGEDHVLRRPPFGSKVKRAHDMGREYRVLSALSAHRDWAPKPVAYSDDPGVMGAEFYLMKKIDGVILRRKAPEDFDEAMARRLSETLLDTLVDMHSLDPEAVGLGELGRPEGYVERQVEGWIQRYGKSATDQIADMESVAAWLRKEMPPSGPGVIIHNDYKFDNVVYDSPAFERIVGVLDWEMATCGDALMDLGTSLSYWVEAGDLQGLKNLSFGPTARPGMLTRQQLAERYAEKTGRDISNILFYFAFGLYKTAVVLQQIYFRYEQGLTKDERFAGLIFGVRLLAESAQRAIERGHISSD